MAAAGLIGTTLGGYAVEVLLGRGGMASVDRGRDLPLQRPVAIKVLAERVAALPGFAERFRQEARLVANLRYPNIVQIYAIHALGIILYALLTGHVPFAASDPLAVLIQHRHTPPSPPRTLRPELPPSVDAVVLRALAKDPGARYASAGTLAEALRQAWPPSVAAGGIHQVATRRWTPGPAGYPAAVTAAQGGPPLAQPTPTPGPVAPQGPASPAPVVAARRRTRLLPVLGALLLLAFVGALFLALRGTPEVVEEPIGAPTVAATAPDPAVMVPSEAGAQATGAAPAPARDGTATSAPAPSLPAAPVAAVRALLAGGVQDGSAGPQGAALVATLDAARQALDQGDAAETTGQLVALQRTLLQEARAGTLEPDLLRRALSGIDLIAEEHQLILPLTVSAG